MSTIVIFATRHTALADAWERQLPPGRLAVRLGAQGFPATTPAIPAIVVLDAVCEFELAPWLAKCPTIFVGEPHTTPYEQARIGGRAHVYLAYEESHHRLRDYLPLVEEIAEKQALAEMLVDKRRRVDVPRVPVRTAVADSVELWDFLEGALENMESEERLIAEFRRASRQLLRASHFVFFHREADGFRADRGTSFFAETDPMVSFFEAHPTVVDAGMWEGPVDVVAELAIRTRLAMWGARMFVPVHDNGRLLGLIALGVRDDGQPYDDADKDRAVFFARLLRNFLVKSIQLGRLTTLAETASIGAKYLPGTLVLGPDESAPRHVPVVVRDLIGQARRTRQVCRIAPTDGQPFRGSAGIVAETGGTWAFWQEASGEVHDAAVRERAGRRELIREIALTLGHEVGNALVSLNTLRQLHGKQQVPVSLLENVANDVAKLQTLNEHFGVMQNLHERDVAPVDLREMVRGLGESMGIRAEVGPDPVVVQGNKRLLDFALRALVCTLAENRPDLGTADLAVKLRSTGAGAALTALVSVKGKSLELEGILPEPTHDAVPNQGRIGVFLAKEILRLHNGEIHAGPGMEGTEILVSLRSW